MQHLTLSVIVAGCAIFGAARLREFEWRYAYCAKNKELKPKSRLPTCSNCRASMGTWGRRTAAEVLIRRRKLHIYDMRMEMVVLHPRNVRAAPALKPFVSATALRKLSRAKKNGAQQYTKKSRALSAHF